MRELLTRASGGVVFTTEGEVIDIFTAAGLSKPDISILSDQFLAEVRGLKHKNAAAELLEKLLKDELKVRSKRNLVQSQLFSEKLKKTLNAYHNRAISTMEVIEELIKLAKEMDAATKRGEDLGLTDDEVAFYDALTANESAIKAMGDDKLKDEGGMAIILPHGVLFRVDSEEKIIETHKFRKEEDRYSRRMRLPLLPSSK